MKIYKYELQTWPGTIKKITCDEGNLIPLTARVQHGAAQAWCEVHAAPGLYSIYVYCANTGSKNPIEIDRWNYMGTVEDGPYIWHYYWTSDESLVDFNRVVYEN